MDLNMYLSASFEGKEKDPKKEGVCSSGDLTGPEASLECMAIVLNINHGQNQGLISSCRRLYEYSYLVSQIRRYLSQGLTLGGAADKAIDDCLKEGILVEYLTKHRAEATMSILTEYDEEKILRYTFRDGKAEGWAEGRVEGKAEGKMEHRISLICCKLKKGKTVEQIAEDLEEDVSAIRPVYEAVLSNGPEADHQKILRTLFPDGILNDGH